MNMTLAYNGVLKGEAEVEKVLLREYTQVTPRC